MKIKTLGLAFSGLIIIAMMIEVMGCKKSVKNVQKTSVKKEVEKGKVKQFVEQKKEASKKKKNKIHIKISKKSKIIDKRIKKHIDWKNKDEIKFLKEYVKTNEMTDKKFYNEYELKPEIFDSSEEYEKKKANALIVDGIIKYKTDIMKKKYDDYINSEQYKKDFQKFSEEYIKNPPFSKEDLNEMFDEDYDKVDNETKKAILLDYIIKAFNKKLNYRSKINSEIATLKKLVDKYYEMGPYRKEAMYKYDKEKSTYKEHYKPREILFFPWGKGKGNIGTGKSAQYNIKFYTNVCLAESKNGYLYLMDGINRILYVYSPKYQLIKIEENFIDYNIKDIKTYDNTIYILTAKDKNDYKNKNIVAVRVIDKIVNNKIILSYIIDKMLGTEGWIRRDDPNTFYINKGRIIAWDNWYGTTDKPFKMENIKKINDMFILNNDEKIIYDRINEKFIYKGNGKEIFHGYIKSLNSTLEDYYENIYWDDYGNSYYVYSTFREKNIDRYYEEITKLDKKGNIITRIVINLENRYDDHIGVTYYIKVTRNGNIYELCPKKDGLHIIKWERKK